MTTYCERWVFATNKATSEMSVDVARAKHVHRQPYTALVDSSSKPTIVVAIAAEFVTVYFVDQQSRWYLQYDFSERRPNWLFLQRVIFREFVDGTSKILRAQTHVFEENGSFLIEACDLSKDETRSRKGTDSVVEHWEPYPIFGEYEGICRIERG